MTENTEIDELNEIFSLPRIDILKYLWSKGQPVDTHMISEDLHMSMEDVYQHLMAMELEKVVKMENVKTKTGDKRYWSAATDKFNILIKADKGNFTYTSDLKQQLAPTMDIVNEKIHRKLNSDKKISIILILAVAAIVLSAVNIFFQFLK